MNNIFATYNSVDPIPQTEQEMLEDYNNPYLTQEDLPLILKSTKVKEDKQVDKNKDKDNIQPLPWFQGFIQTLNSTLISPSIKGNKRFEEAFDAVIKKLPQADKYRKLLTIIAKNESGFDPHIQNKAGAPAYGYFQFMQDGKNWDNITKYAGTDITTFRNNPELQIEAAVKLASDFANSFTKEDLELAKQQGYSMDALISGAWLGGVGGVRKVLRKQGNPTDKHWSKSGKGTSVKERMDLFKYQKGGKGPTLIREKISKETYYPLADKNKELTDDQIFSFIHYLENPNNKGYSVVTDKYHPYDNSTVGTGLDFKTGFPELRTKLKNGITSKENKDITTSKMKRNLEVIKDNLVKQGLTTLPDTISPIPLLLMSQARYHYGNIVKSFPEWGKAVVSGDSKTIKEKALKLAKGYKDRYDKIKQINIYGKNPQIDNYEQQRVSKTSSNLPFWDQQ